MNATGVKILMLVLAAASFEMQTVSGCTCSTTHPQQHYCTANYVLRGRVVLLRWQLIPGVPPETNTVTDTVTNPSTEAVVTQATGTTAEGMGMTALTTTPAQNSSEAAFVSSQPTVMDAMPAHRSGERLLINRIINQEPWNYEIIYTVKIEDVFKMEEGSSLTTGEEMELTSSYPGAGFCGVELKAGKSYLLAGGDEGRISRCDLIQEYRDLSKRHKQALRNNYWELCDKCQIQTCHNPQCTADVPTNTCAYTPRNEYDRHGIGYQDNDCVAHHSRCNPKGKKEKCQWQRNEDLKKCQRDSRRAKSKKRRGSKRT